MKLKMFYTRDEAQLDLSYRAFAVLRLGASVLGETKDDE